MIPASVRGGSHLPLQYNCNNPMECYDLSTSPKNVGLKGIVPVLSVDRHLLCTLQYYEECNGPRVDRLSSSHPKGCTGQVICCPAHLVDATTILPRITCELTHPGPGLLVHSNVKGAN